MITAPGVTPVIVIIVTMISAGDSSHGAESSNTGSTNRSGTDLLTKIKIQFFEKLKITTKKHKTCAVELKLHSKRVSKRLKIKKYKKRKKYTLFVILKCYNAGSGQCWIFDKQWRMADVGRPNHCVDLVSVGL